MSAPAPVPPGSSSERVRLTALAQHVLRMVSPVRLHHGAGVDAMLAGRFVFGGFATLLLVLFGVLSVITLMRVVVGRAGLADWGWLAFVVLGAFAAWVQPLDAVLSTRFAYLGTLPLMPVAGVLLDGAVRGLPSRARALAAAIGMVVVAGLALLAVLEAEHHTDDVAFLERRVALRPDDVPAIEALSEHYRREAERLRSTLVALPSHEVRQSGITAKIRVLTDQAFAWGQRATKHPLGRKRASAWAQLGLAMLSQGRQADAIPSLIYAVKLDPLLHDAERLRREVAAGRTKASAELLFALGRAHEVMGAPEEAAEPYLQAARLAPERLAYVRKAGLGLNAVERFPEGMALLERAWTMARGKDRDEMDELLRQQRGAQDRLARRAMLEGNEARDMAAYKSAVNSYKQALAIQPALAEAHLHVGWVLGWYFGRYVEAFEHLNEAERLMHPDDPLRSQVQRRRSEIEAQRAKEDEEERGT